MMCMKSHDTFLLFESLTDWADKVWSSDLGFQDRPCFSPQQEGQPLHGRPLNFWDEVGQNWWSDIMAVGLTNSFARFCQHESKLEKSDFALLLFWPAGALAVKQRCRPWESFLLEAEALCHASSGIGQTCLKQTNGLAALTLMQIKFRFDREMEGTWNSLNGHYIWSEWQERIGKEGGTCGRNMIICAWIWCIGGCWTN